MHTRKHRARRTLVAILARSNPALGRPCAQSELLQKRLRAVPRAARCCRNLPRLVWRDRSDHVRLERQLPALGPLACGARRTADRVPGSPHARDRIQGRPCGRHRADLAATHASAGRVLARAPGSADRGSEGPIHRGRGSGVGVGVRAHVRHWNQGPRRARITRAPACPRYRFPFCQHARSGLDRAVSPLHGAHRCST